jgi:dihydropyrimidine dehydrogenase (NAD+) subunit PreT
MPEYAQPTTEAEVANHFEQLKPLMSPTIAYYESSRCLFCFDAPCVTACPTHIDIPLFIRQINTGNVEGAAKTIYDANYFGNACGKVCPTSELCEGACVYNHQNVKPLEIGRLQSFATRTAMANNSTLYTPAASNGKKVAIIGAGPAGIAAACELRLHGYEVDIFEAKERPSGLALHGCAPYKITNEEILEEVDYLQAQFGFRIHYKHLINNKKQLHELEAHYDAIFLGIGLGPTTELGIKGEDLPRCVGATEFIEEVKLHPLEVAVGKRVVVIGGGNTAMDAASEAARLGAKEVVLAYRRSKAEMGAYHFEYELAKGAGVKGVFNASPVKILGKKRVKGVRFVQTSSADGTLHDLPKSEFDLRCDMVIMATGQSKQTDFLSMINELETDKKGRIKTVPNTYQTTNPKYFAGGDAVNGGAEVVNACAEAKLAAKAIHAFLGKGGA